MTETRYLLTCLMEECAEVQKECAKALRFGLKNNSPRKNMTNAECISDELADILGVASMLVRMGAIVPFTNVEKVNEKIRKVRKYMLYSEKEGILKIGGHK